MRFGESPRSKIELLEIEGGTRVISCDHFCVHWMKDRGRNDYRKESWKSQALPESWIAHEGDLKFEFRSNTGSSSGLFLDQRANRRWVRAQSKDLRVLNLFSYTGGFSV